MDAYVSGVKRKMKRFFDWLSGKIVADTPQSRPPNWGMAASSTSPAFCSAIRRRFGRV